MNTEDLTLDDGTDTEIVKDFSAIFPWVGVTILTNSLIVEPVYGSNLSGFVVSSQQCDVGRVLEL